MCPIRCETFGDETPIDWKSWVSARSIAPSRRPVCSLNEDCIWAAQNPGSVDVSFCPSFVPGRCCGRPHLRLNVPAERPCQRASPSAGVTARVLPSVSGPLLACQAGEAVSLASNATRTSFIGRVNRVLTERPILDGPVRHLFCTLFARAFFFSAFLLRRKSIVHQTDCGRCANFAALGEARSGWM